MPLDGAELRGTEKDGSKSAEYCKYCYSDGVFITPGITLEEMRSLITERMEKEQIPEDIIEAAVNRLSLLKRWRVKISQP